MCRTRQNKQLALRCGMLACLLFLTTTYALAAENQLGQTGQLSGGQQTQTGSPTAPPTPVPSPAPFVPTEEISTGKSVSFPNDI